MPHVFTYGSLMFDAVWNLVVKGEYEKSTATLANYIRRAVINEEYPAVFHQTGSSGVVGILYYTSNRVIGPRNMVSAKTGPEAIAFPLFFYMPDPGL